MRSLGVVSFTPFRKSHIMKRNSFAAAHRQTRLPGRGMKSPLQEVVLCNENNLRPASF